MKQIEKIDPLTGEIFTAFRSNQVFASDENRIRYNNIKAKGIRTEKADVEKPLHNNFRILKALMEGKNEEIFHKQFLLGKGYTLSVMTHKEIINGIGYTAIYNFITIPLAGSENLKIVRI